MNIVKRVYSTIAGYDLIRPGETVLMGVSGGPDSVAMFHLLREILEAQKELQWKLHVAHLNHGLRGKEADEDERFVKELTKKYRIPYTAKKVKLLEIKAQTKGSIEELGRKARHAFLQELALELKAQKIALAHNLDDQAETVLHRIIRGTGLRGLKGITPIRLVSQKSDLFIVRPLIELERREIEEYLKERGYTYRVDSTNQDQTLTRNRIRHTLIPLLEKEFNPKMKLSLVKLSQTAASFYLLLKEIANEIYENIKMLGGEEEVCLSVEEFVKTPPALQTLIIDKAVTKLLGRLPQLHFEHYLEILSLCSEEGYAKAVTLPKGLAAKHESYILKIYKQRKPAPPLDFISQEIRVPGTTTVEKLKIQIETELLEGKAVGLQDYVQSKDYMEELVDYDKLESPLAIRLRRHGDVFVPLGAHGGGKLKKFFIDSKVPKDMRNRVPLLADRKKIVWVVGYRIGDAVKITEHTRRILKLKVHRLLDKT